MSGNQPEIKNRRRYLTIVLVLAALLLTMAVGGVSAFLSMSSSTSNTFSDADQPTVTVSGTSVTVDPKGYGVYLRVAIDAAWVENGMISTEEPTEYTISDKWKEIDGFYYYTEVISGTTPTTVTPVTYTAITKDGYTLTVNVAAQIIQAAGTTDGENIPAVQDAWGVTPEQITG